MNKVLEYIIGAKDATGEAIKSSIARLREHYNALRGTLDLEEESYRRMSKQAHTTYETLDQINERIDAPKRLAEQAKRAQDEQNRALERYCQLCEEARRREQARLDAMRSPKNQWNQGAGAGVLYRPEDAARAAKGAQAAAGGIEDIGRAAKKTIPAMMALNSAVGSMDGSLGKFARGLTGVINMAMAFGPMGAVVSGAMLAIQTGLDAWYEKQQKLINKINEWNDAMRARLARFRENWFTNLVRELENVERATQRATLAFENAAKARENLAKKREGINAALSERELASMRRDMDADVAEAPDEEKARVSAAWRLKIAERQAELEERASKIAAQNEAERLRTARERLALAEKNAQRLNDSATKADREYSTRLQLYNANYRDDEGESAQAMREEVKRYEGARQAAIDRAQSAWDEVAALRLELESVENAAEVNALERANGIAKAYDAAKSAGYAYDESERKYAEERARQEVAAVEEAQRAREEAAAQEERDRMELERRIMRKRLDYMREELAERSRESMDAERRLSDAVAQEQRAWGWYRNRDSWKSQLEEERAEAQAQKQFDKDFEKLKDRHRDWRTAKLSDEEEVVRRVGLAREEKSKAEEYARETAEAAARAADAIEQIQSTLDGGD